MSTASKENLSERKKALLATIIQDYIETVEPIGSRTICRRYKFALSPATIRNEMAELEEAGLLVQPHTSAGRVPSDKGYRFFVDHLLNPYHPDVEELAFLGRIKQTANAVEAVLSQAVKILSEVSNCIALVEAPTLRANPLKSLHLLSIDDMSVVLTLQYSNGLSQQCVIRLSQPLYAEMLGLLSNYLNAQLKNTLLEELFHKIVSLPMERELSYYRAIVMDMMGEIYSQVKRDEKIYLTGTAQLLKAPEFHKIEKAYPILSMLERQDPLHDLLRQVLRTNTFKGNELHQVKCLIGYENWFAELQECTFMAAPYFIGDRVGGTIGLIGPTRINYAKSLTLLEAVANNLSLSLTRLFN